MLQTAVVSAVEGQAPGGGLRLSAQHDAILTEGSLQCIRSVGTIFFGSEGYLIFPDYSSYYTFLGPHGEPGPSKAEEGHPMMDRPHMENWIAAVRARDHTLLTADIEEAHKTMVLCLLPRAAYETEQPAIHFDPETESVLDNEEADRPLNQPAYRAPYVVPKEV